MNTTFADIPPIPVDPRIAARQALHMRKLIDDAGSVSQGVDEAAALEAGMAAKSAEFRAQGAEVYRAE